MILSVQTEKLIRQRKGEKKLGEHLLVFKGEDWQKALQNLPKEIRFIILGIPESIGILGNSGRSGAENAWSAFLNAFLNLQNNRFLSGEAFGLLGAIDVSDLQERAKELHHDHPYYLQKLHVLCEELDERVEAIALQIFEAGAIPIAIGGGHNNAYPLIKAAALASASHSVNAINMDAHADFRHLEGRHSGNAFSYALQRGYLNRYYALGLHHSYNSEHMLQVMEGTLNVGFSFFEDIAELQETFETAIQFVDHDLIRTGIELDMDAIRYMPSSAQSPSGFSLEQSRSYVKECVSKLKPAYLHLPEAAPQTEQEALMVGKALAYLVSDFAKAFLNKELLSSDSIKI